MEHEGEAVGQRVLRGRDFADAADYLFLSSAAMPDYRAFMSRMIREGKKLVVCTHGRNGSTALDTSGNWVETPILRRSDLALARVGPLIIEEYDATCVIPPGAKASLDAGGNIVIELSAETRAHGA